MKKYRQMTDEQKDFIRECIVKANEFLADTDLSEIAAVLLSGSVARGDFNPGRFGGMTDLTVIKQKNSTLSAEEIFGKDEDPPIPYHCVRRKGQWFSIAFHSYIDETVFRSFDEAKKFAFCESRLLWQAQGAYSAELEAIAAVAQTEQRQYKANSVGYIHYLLSEYKCDRWLRRDAYPQLHENLSTAIRQAIMCLYYINKKYAAAEDRRLYYSYDLALLPQNYDTLVAGLLKADIDSAANYRRRSTLFHDELLRFVERS